MDLNTENKIKELEEKVRNLEDAIKELGEENVKKYILEVK